MPTNLENYILNVKREHASWGARKIRERLIRRFSDIPIPAKSTIHAVLIATVWWNVVVAYVVVLKGPLYP